MSVPANIAANLPIPGKVHKRDVVEVVWEIFISLKLTIPLLILIALSCVLGTFTSPTAIPLADVQKAWGTGFAYKVIVAFEMHDLFHSWWFSVLLVTLLCNLIACSIDRLPRIYRIALFPEEKLTDKVLRGIRQHVKVQPLGDVGSETARISAAFKARGFLPRIHKDEDGTTYLFAERGRFARFGVYVVHLALVVILMGGIAGRIWGYDGAISVAEGGGLFDFIFLKASDGSSYKKNLGFVVRVDDFRLQKFANGGPRAFESDLTVIDHGKETVKQTIAVNHPLHYGGWTFYQASYQPAPDRTQAKLIVTDRKTGAKKEAKVQGGTDFGFGDGVKFAVVDYQPSYAELGPAVHVVRAEEGKSTDFWVFQNYPEFDRDNREDRYALSFGGLEEVYFTGLQVARDPGANIVFLGCLIMFIGLMQAFYTSHRRLWARITDKEVVVAGGAHKNHYAFETVFESLTAAVKGEKVVPAAETP